MDNNIVNACKCGQRCVTDNYDKCIDCMFISMNYQKNYGDTIIIPSCECDDTKHPVCAECDQYIFGNVSGNSDIMF